MSQLAKSLHHLLVVMSMRRQTVSLSFMTTEQLAEPELEVERLQNIVYSESSDDQMRVIVPHPFYHHAAAL